MGGMGLSWGLLFGSSERAAGVDGDCPDSPGTIGKVEARGDVERERRWRGARDDVRREAGRGAVGLANGSAGYLYLHVEVARVARENERGDFGGVEGDVGREAGGGGKGAADYGESAESDVGLRVGEGEGEAGGDAACDDDLRGGIDGKARLHEGVLHVQGGGVVAQCAGRDGSEGGGASA